MSLILSFLSLFFIIIENSMSSNGAILITSLPFISYNARKGGNIIYLFLAYLLISVQTDRYFYIFFILSIYAVLNIILLSYIEYNKKTVFYILIIQIIFYLLLSYKFLSIKYFIINLCGFIIWNYIYARSVENKGK